MDLQAIVAAMPWLKKLWDWLPRRLRFPLLGLALVVWLYRRARGKDGDDTTPGDATEPAAAPDADDAAAG